MDPLTRSLARLAAGGFVLAVIVTLASAFAPQSQAPHLFPWDKANHFLAFYVMSLLGAAGLPRLKLAWLAAGLVALGAAIEVLQATPLIGRDGEVLDWVADAVGVGFAFAPFWLVRWRARWAENET